VYLGQTSVGQQAGSMAASAVSKYGATSLASAMGAGSAAGPIGMVVGLLVSFLFSLFGPKIKDPVFGVVAVVPETDSAIVKVGRMLDLLNKPMFDLGYTWGIRDQTQRDNLGKQIKAFLDSAPQGALSITSGGLPTSHPQVSKVDFGKLLTFTSKIAKPFTDVLSLMTDQTKNQILNEPLAYKASASYYFQIGETPTKQLTSQPGSKKNENRWATAGIAQVYDAVKISGGKTLGPSLEKAWHSIPKQINDVFVKYAGIDIMSGTVVNQELASKAFKPASSVSSSVASILPSSILGWAILIGGLILFKR
jgi:hypothetical protein